MTIHIRPWRLAALLLVAAAWPSLAPACCPVPPSGKPVVNADQTVILIWDPASRTEHFIRQASFKSEAEDFGFLVPTPNQPELDESGDEAFPYLRKLTEPERRTASRPSGGCGCGCAPAGTMLPAGVNVLEDRLVAGFHAVVLEAKSADSLTGWLKDHGYAYSAEVESWAKPYVERGWKITALKVAKDEKGGKKDAVSAASLRISFKTEVPLFPYREPDPTSSAAALGAKKRLLRVYFVSDGRYRGELTEKVGWTGKVAWADAVSAKDRMRALEKLRLPESTGPAEWWLTEFEDDWPYRAAPADVSFLRDADQQPVKRPPIIEYVVSPWPNDVMVFALAGVMILPPFSRWMRRTRAGRTSPGNDDAGGGPESMAPGTEVSPGVVDTKAV